MSHCSYLGHVVGNGEVSSEKDKINAVANVPTPTTKKQVRAFLGLTGYYHKFIPDFADHAAILNDLTKKDAPNQIRWTDMCNEAFKTLKTRLCSQPSLKRPDINREFISQTDATDRGVGAVLSQKDEDGIKHPVAFLQLQAAPT